VGGDDDLNDLYEHAPCGYLSMQPDGTIVRVNATLLDWLRATREQLVGRRFQELLTVPGRIFHDTHYMPLLAMQGFAREIAFDLVRAGAPPLPAVITTSAHRDASGRVDLYRTIVFESSSRRSYEQELLRQRRAAEHEASTRAALLAMISHDVRSPLSSILMAVDLADDASDARERVKYTQIIRKASNSILELVNAILEHSRLEAGATVWEPQPTNLRALLSEIAAIHSVKTDAKGIALRTEVDGAVPELLMADRYKLGQIVTNLVSNAIKFTSQGHVLLALRARSVNGRVVSVELRVADTGIGIPADKLEAIFEEYRQASPDTQRHYGGTGLGLAISRKLAALAGTTIEVESTVGVGTTFACVLRLPIPPLETRIVAA